MFPKLLSGMEIRSYLLQEEIGLGGMAVVYRAYQPSVNRNVAMKIIRVDESSIRNVGVFRKRFAQEARVVASLEHIHILPIYDYGIEGDIAFIAMRYLPGGTLAKVMASGALSLDRATELFTQIASGLDYAHRKGVIHRDVKPGNILLDDEGNAYLTDFGLAKWKDDANSITEEDTIVGTLAYISPEQLIGVPVDHRADIYSLGIMLYECLSGDVPFKGDSEWEVLKGHESGEVVFPASMGEPYRRMIGKMLAKDPAQRFASVDEVLSQLRAPGRLGESILLDFGRSRPFAGKAPLGRPDEAPAPAPGAQRQVEVESVGLVAGLLRALVIALLLPARVLGIGLGRGLQALARIPVLILRLVGKLSLILIGGIILFLMMATAWVLVAA